MSSTLLSSPLDGDVAPAFDVHPVTWHLGAEVHGIDLAGDLSDQTIVDLRATLTRHRVLFFRGQELTAEQQVAFAGRFGPLTAAHPNVTPGSLGNNVLEFDSSRGGRADHWHSDVSFVERPPLASLLYAIEIPPVGADTAWANAVRAYETLPAPLRALADTLWISHSNDFDYSTVATTAEDQANLKAMFSANSFRTLHPAVRVIEESGERALFLGGFAGKFEGFSSEDSRSVYEVFQRHVTDISNTARWRWAAGDLAMWDNRTTQHSMVRDYEEIETRRLRRVTVAGPAAISTTGEVSRPVIGDVSSYSPPV